MAAYAYAQDGPTSLADPSGLRPANLDDGYDMSDPEFNDQATYDEDFSLHESVVSYSSAQIPLRDIFGAVFGGDIGSVTLSRDCNRIPGASNTDPKSGNEANRKDGFADIIRWGDADVKIWEVKYGTNLYGDGSGPGETVGPTQLRRYVTRLQAKLLGEGDQRKV